MGLSVVYPLDTLKIRMQTYPQCDTLRKAYVLLVQTDGFFSLYRGILSPVLGFGACFAGVSVDLVY